MFSHIETEEMEKRAVTSDKLPIPELIIKHGEFSPLNGVVTGKTFCSMLNIHRMMQPSITFAFLCHWRCGLSGQTPVSHLFHLAAEKLLWQIWNGHAFHASVGTTSSVPWLRINSAVFYSWHASCECFGRPNVWATWQIRGFGGRGVHSLDEGEKIY